MSNSLGDFIKNKRISLNYSLRKLARDTDISVTYLSDIETGRKTNISKEIIERIGKELSLSDIEIEELYSLVGTTNNAIPTDVEEFIKKHPLIVPYLREVKRGEHKNWLREIGEDGKD